MRFYATPRATAEALERLRPLTPGRGERFTGYGIMGLPFRGGDYLAFRRFVASSIGPAYYSLWHQDRDGRWTFYVDVEPGLSCPRYFSAALDRVEVTEIVVSWGSASELAISLPAARIEVSLRLATPPRARLMNSVLRLVPERAWESSRALALMSAVAGPVLGAGEVRLTGHTPNGQQFGVAPRQLWRIVAGAAVIHGRELGPFGALPRQPRLADFVQPNAGIFAFGSVWFDPVEPGGAPAATDRAHAGALSA